MYHVYLITHYIVCGVAELWQDSSTLYYQPLHLTSFIFNVLFLFYLYSDANKYYLTWLSDTPSLHCAVILASTFRFLRQIKISLTIMKTRLTWHNLFHSNISTVHTITFNLPNLEQSCDYFHGVNPAPPNKDGGWMVTVLRRFKHAARNRAFITQIRSCNSLFPRIKRFFISSAISV